jgi:type I restriction enzyme S subunit
VVSGWELVKKSESSGKLNTIRLKISFETLGDQLLPLPPPLEQSAIVIALNSETTRIDTLIAKTKQSIGLLKKRRSALITAAVTGQIDLREST